MPQEEHSPSAPSSERKKTSGLAVASLVCSLIFFFPLVPLVGVILAIVSLSTNRGRMRGHGLAVAGLIVGIVMTVFFQVLLVAVAVPSFRKYMDRSRAAKAQLSDGAGEAPQIVRSKDGWVEVTPPAHWTLIEDLNEQASIQLGSQLLEEYFVVISDYKSDYGGTLQDYGEFTSKAILESLDNGTRSSPRPMQVAARDALQYEITGTLSNRIKATYLHTVVEGETGMHQLLAWTIPSHRIISFPLFQKVIASFREVQGATLRSSAHPTSLPGATLATQSLTASDGSAKLSVPAAFALRSDLVEGAILQTGDEVANTFLIMQRFDKSDVDGTLEKFAEQSAREIQGNLKQGAVSFLGKRQAGILPSVEYRIEGSTDQVRLIYYAAYIRGTNAYFELLMWTLPSNDANALDVFHRITSSFEEVLP